MNANTKFILAVLVTAFVAFFAGWLIFGILFSDYYGSNLNSEANVLMKEPPEMWAIAISNLAWATLITWVLQKTRNTSMGAAFATSFWVSFLVILVFNFSVYAFWNLYPLGFIVVDTIISSVFWGAIGIISGAVLRSGKKVVSVT